MIDDVLDFVRTKCVLIVALILASIYSLSLSLSIRKQSINRSVEDWHQGLRCDDDFGWPELLKQQGSQRIHPVENRVSVVVDSFHVSEWDKPITKLQHHPSSPFFSCLDCTSKRENKIARDQ
jgi:hypothetical protein